MEIIISYENSMGTYAQVWYITYKKNKAFSLKSTNRYSKRQKWKIWPHMRTWILVQKYDKILFDEFESNLLYENGTLMEM